MNTQTQTQTITIPKSLTKSNDLVVVEKRYFEELTKENTELQLAVKAILEGELALHQKKTRSFKEFLKVKFPKYAKSY